MRKEFTGIIHIFQSNHTKPKVYATVDTEHSQFEYYPVPKCFKDTLADENRRGMGVTFTANEDGTNPRNARMPG